MSNMKKLFSKKFLSTFLSTLLMVLVACINIVPVAIGVITETGWSYFAYILLVPFDVAYLATLAEL